MNKISIARNFRKTRKSFLVKSKELKKYHLNVTEHIFINV